MKVGHKHRRSPKGLKNSVCENKVYPAGADKSFVLNMKNGLPYLSKELFWRAMEDIAGKAKRISGHKWNELKDMIDNRAHHFVPTTVRKRIVEWLEHFHPAPISRSKSQSRSSFWIGSISDLWSANRKGIRSQLCD